jgi:hypothetical protein
MEDEGMKHNLTPKFNSHTKDSLGPPTQLK